MWVSVCIAIHRRMKVPSDLALPAHVLLPSASRLDLGSYVQCSNVGPRLYLHLLPDEGSMVISKIFISMVMGQGQFRHPLLCQRTIWGSLLGPGIPFIIKSLVNPKLTSIVEIYSSLNPYLSFLPRPLPVPQAFPIPPLLPSL